MGSPNAQPVSLMRNNGYVWVDLFVIFFKGDSSLVLVHITHLLSIAQQGQCPIIGEKNSKREFGPKSYSPDAEKSKLEEWWKDKHHVLLLLQTLTNPLLLHRDELSPLSSVLGPDPNKVPPRTPNLSIHYRTTNQMEQRNSNIPMVKSSSKLSHFFEWVTHWGWYPIFISKSYRTSHVLFSIFYRRSQQLQQSYHAQTQLTVENA